MAAARNLKRAARFAAYATGQAAVTAHLAAHELGAAAYAIKAIKESVKANDRNRVGQRECQWQRDQLPEEIRGLVINDQKLRNSICWFAFDC